MTTERSAMLDEAVEAGGVAVAKMQWGDKKRITPRATCTDAARVAIEAAVPLIENHARKEERHKLEARLRSTAERWRKRTYGTPEARHFGRSYADKLEALASEETDQPEESNRWRCQRCRFEFATNYRSCPSCGHTVYDPIKERKR